MPLKAITVYKPVSVEENPYILSSDDGAIYNGILGGVSGILPVYGRMAATKQSDNSVRIGSGVVSVCGRIGRIRSGDFETVTITNGTSGYKRHDFIVAEYTSVSEGEDIKLKVITGSPTTQTPEDPAVQQQDIDANGTIYQLPLYRVILNGVSIASVVRIAEILPSVKEVKEDFNEHVAAYMAAVPPHILKFSQTYMGHIADCNDVINGSGMITPQTKNRPPGNGYGPLHSANGSQYSIGYYRNRTSSVGAGSWSEWAPTPYGVFLPLAGGTMTGAINTGGHTVHGLPTPTGSTWATPKSYVDAEVSKATTQTKAAITLKNGFSASTDASDRAPAAVKGADGRVVLQGRAKASSPTNTIIGQVPAAMKPPKRVMGVVVANEGTTQHMVPCFVLATGDIQLQWTRQMSVITAVSFDGICYDL